MMKMCRVKGVIGGVAKRSVQRVLQCPDRYFKRNALEGSERWPFPSPVGRVLQDNVNPSQATQGLLAKHDST